MLGSGWIKVHKHPTALPACRLVPRVYSYFAEWRTGLNIRLTMFVNHYTVAGNALLGTTPGIARLVMSMRETRGSAQNCCIS